MGMHRVMRDLPPDALALREAVARALSMSGRDVSPCPRKCAHCIVMATDALAAIVAEHMLTARAVRDAEVRLIIEANITAKRHGLEDVVAGHRTAGALLRALAPFATDAGDAP